MSVKYHSQYSGPPEAKRANAAYRNAERLGRGGPRRSTEWQRICAADMEQRVTAPFADIFAEELDEAETVDFVDVPEPDSRDHMIRSAYLLAAVMAGTFCMVLGGMVLI